MQKKNFQYSEFAQDDCRLAKLAVEANRAGNYFHTDSTKEYEASLKQAEQDKNKEPKKRMLSFSLHENRLQFLIKENWENLQAILKDQHNVILNLMPNNNSPS